MIPEIAAAHKAIRHWFVSALEVVDPRSAVLNAMRLEHGALYVGNRAVPLAADSRVVVIAIGKAAHRMAEGAREVFGERIGHGVVLTKYGHLGRPVEGFVGYEAGHPVPDEQGLRASREVMRAVSNLQPQDCVIALISGGGSALLEQPHEGISLHDMQAVTRRLMLAGADIHEMNAVRTALSRVKGGGLRRAIGPARCVSLLLSDVLGNDPSVIASGPTVMPTPRTGEALAILARFGLAGELPPPVVHALGKADADALVPDTRGDIVHVVADNAVFIRRMAEEAQSDGKRVLLDTDPYAGEASELGRAWVRDAREAEDDVDVIIRGGEATVRVTGDGVGGRNTEMALAASLAMEASDAWVVASLASDGDDGNSGAAGAIADPGSATRARDEGIDPAEALRRNDSASVFRAAGGLVVTGPTGTNVNDVYVAMRLGRRGNDAGEGR